MPRKKKQPGPGEEGHQETISAVQFFGEVLHNPTIDPSYVRRPTIIYLYICLHCGWWDISTGVDEVFGSLVRHAGPRTEPCERCQQGPMYLVKREDALHTAIESQQEGE